MPSQDHLGPFHRFIELMDQAKDAIDRHDVVHVEALERQVSDMTDEMRTLFSAAGDPSTIAGMESPLHQALEQVTLNQKRLSAWIHETENELGKLQQGAVAVRRYGASVPLGSTVLEKRV
jgi:hypothetical protein